MDPEEVDVRRYGDLRLTDAAARLQNAVEQVVGALSMMMEAGTPNGYREAIEWAREERAFPNYIEARDEFAKQVRNAAAFLSNKDEVVAQFKAVALARVG